MSQAARPPAFDPRQTAAIAAGPGLVRVVAGAGTGKTTVLTHRIARLVNEGQDPARILATTFTNKAATEMKERLQALCGPRGSLVEVRTIDSAALRVCLRNPEAAGLRSSPMVAGEDESRELLEKAGLAEGLLYEGMERKEKAEVLREFALRVSAWKSACLTPDMHDGSTGRDWVAAWRRYEDELSARNLLDFPDLVLRALRALEDPDVLRREAGRLDWMHVDEFQDTGAAQLRFLSRLSSRCGNVFVVGDPDQSIYSFRKAMLDPFGGAAQAFPEAAARGDTLVELVVNRRCTEQVLVPACRVVAYNDGREGKELRSGRDGPPVVLSDHADQDGEAQDVAREIEALIGAGERMSQIAVLGRVARVLEPVSVRLAARGIRFRMRGGLRFSERSEVRDVMAYVRLAVNPSLDLSFLRIAARPSRGIGPTSAQAVLARASAGVPLHEVLDDMSRDRGWRAEAREGAASLSRHLRTLAALRDAGRPPREAVEYILGDIGYSDWAMAREDAPKTLHASLHGLLALSERHDDLAEFAREAVLDPDAEEEADEAVQLSTIHAAKGLEWRNVFLVGAEQGIIPSRRALNDRGDPDDPWDYRAAGGAEEERRLFHVALTRSAHRLFISRAHSRIGSEGRAKPSSFLHEAGFDTSSIRPPPLAQRGGRGGKGPAKPASRKMMRYF